MTETANKINDTIKRINNLEKANDHYQYLVRNLEIQQNALSKITITLDKELRDIENLEGISVRGLFHKVLGNKESELEKERQEYLAVALKHKEIKKSIELEEYEMKLLSKKVEEIEKLESSLHKLKEKREKEILRLNLPEKHILNKTIKYCNF